MPIEVKSAIVCDLVRTEDSGKHILIGVYSGTIAPDILPAKLSLTFWIEFVPFIRNGTMDYELKLDVPGAGRPTMFSGSMVVEQEDTVLLLPRVSFDAAKPGDLVLSMRPKGGRWTKIVSKPIIPSATAS